MTAHVTLVSILLVIMKSCTCLHVYWPFGYPFSKNICLTLLRLFLLGCLSSSLLIDFEEFLIYYLWLLYMLKIFFLSCDLLFNYLELYFNKQIFLILILTWASLLYHFTFMISAISFFVFCIFYFIYLFIYYIYFSSSMET